MSPPERLTFGHGVLTPVLARPAVAAAALAHEPPRVQLSRLDTWDWGWGGLLIFTILLFFRPQDRILPLSSLHLSDAAAMLGLAAMVVLNLSRRKPISRFTPELAGVLALGAILLIGVPFSFWPGGSFKVFTDQYLQITLIFLLMINTVTSPKRVERLCWVIVLAFGYMAVIVIFNYLRGVNLVEGNRASGPIGGIFQNPNDLALNMVAFLPLAMMYAKRRGPVIKRLLSLGICLLMLLAVVFTKSRSGQLGAAAMLVAYLLFTRSLKPHTVIALVMTGMFILPMLPASYWQRMDSIFNAEKDPTGSRDERWQLMKRAWGIFLEYPLFGIGAGQFENYGDAVRDKKWRVTHNALLEIAAELGVFAVIAYMFLIVRAFSAAWWTRRALAWIYRRPPPPRRLQRAVAGAQRRVSAVRPEEDGLDDQERLFLQTTSAALVACMTGWFVCAMFASVAFNWTFYYLLCLSVTSRDIVRARARAYATARAQAAQETTAA